MIDRKPRAYSTRRTKTYDGKDLDWNSLDWRRPNWELAVVTGKSSNHIGVVRKRLGKPQPIRK